ncbi:MAG: hypothetical protein IJM62_02260 [Lachnospiraceae bacterium]|nr:hypothetical protein [Lachnospiraceae bacterium]
MPRKTVTYDKLSKKEKKKADRLKRLTWGNVKPGTITHKDEREYSRRRVKRATRKEIEQYSRDE